MPEETTTFEAMVSAGTGRPFVQMTCALDGEPVFAWKMSPAVCTALGLRAVQAAIESERDAGLVGFVLGEFSDQIEMPEGDERKQLAGVFLDGMRRHREQFDAEAGSMRPLGDDDPSSLDG